MGWANVSLLPRCRGYSDHGSSGQSYSFGSATHETISILDQEQGFFLPLQTPFSKSQGLRITNIFCVTNILQFLARAEVALLTSEDLTTVPVGFLFSADPLGLDAIAKM